MYGIKSCSTVGLVGFVLAVAFVALPARDCSAVTTVTVTPSTYTLGDVATPVTVQADTDAAGNTLVFDVHFDLDGDGTLDPEDERFMSFEISDGQTPHLDNPGFWHDEDGATNSSVKATLIANGAWLFSGHFIVKATDEDSSTATGSFTVEQDSSFPCVVTGEVQLGGSAAGGAVVGIQDMATGGMASMAVTAADGTFELRIKSPGGYGVLALRPGAVTKEEEEGGSAQMVQVSEGSNPLSQPLVLFPGDRTISGKVFASDTGEGFRGTLVIGETEDGEDLLSFAVTDHDGNYSLPVMDGQWGISPWPEDISRLGYVTPYVWVPVSGSDAQGIDLSCPKATTLIRGTVKDKDTGQGLQGIPVWAELGRDGPEAVGCSGPDGSYVVGVVEGRWEVDVDEESLYGTGYARPPYQHVTAPASGTVSGIDFLLEKAGTITGHVYEDDGETPIGEASVEAHDFETGDWAAWTETLPDGSYTLLVSSGTYTVNVFRVEGWCDQYYLNTPYWDEATPVSVSVPDETGGIDFVLQRGATITGHVYEDDGSTPIAHAWVRAEDATSGDWLAGDDTDTTGFYSISVPSGRYKVRAEADGWPTQYYDGVTHSDEATIITLTAPEERTGIDFVLQRGGSITGYVYEDDGVTPIPGASVDVHEFGTWNWVGWAETLPDGSYTFWVPSGTYRVHVFDVEGWLEQFYLNTPYWEEATPVSVSAPDETSGIDFVLQPAATISGHVYQDDGVTPIGHAWVRAEDATSGDWVAGDDTDQNGSYSISVPSGSYKVRAEADGWPTQYYDGVTHSDEATIITLTAPEERTGIDFVLQRGATISGHVYQMDGVTPVGGAWIAIFDATDWMAGGNTQDDGSYSFSVPSGSYKVKAGADGWLEEWYDDTYDFDEASIIILTAPQQRTDVNFALLEASAAIKGHVYQQDGVTPLAGASVGARDDATGLWMAWAQTDNDGSYTLRVAPGTYRLDAGGWRCNWQQYATPVTVGDSEVIENINFSIECRSFTMEVLRWSTIWTGGLELHWEGQSGASYRVFWSTGSLGNGMTWQEVPNAQDEFRQEGDIMIWTDRGTAPGMNGTPPGDPGARQRFYRVKEEPE